MEKAKPDGMYPGFSLGMPCVVPLYHFGIVSPCIEAIAVYHCIVSPCLVALYSLVSWPCIALSHGIVSPCIVELYRLVSLHCIALYRGIESTFIMALNRIISWPAICASSWSESYCSVRKNDCIK